MSTCISSHGEFGSHTLDPLHYCSFCGVLDEDTLRADLRSAKVEASNYAFQRDEARRKRDEALAEVERLTSELAGMDQVEVRANAVQEENDRLHKLVDDIRQGDGHQVCRAELAEAKEELERQRDDIEKAREVVDSDAYRLATGETCMPGQPASCGDFHNGGHCVRPRVDAVLAVIERRVAADKRVLDAADNAHEDLYAAVRRGFGLLAPLLDAVDARRALVGVEDTPQPAVVEHKCSEMDNGFGGYLCTCGELWPVSFGGCADLPKEQRQANKAAWDEGQKRRAEMLARSAVDRDGEVER